MATPPSNSQNTTTPSPEVTTPPANATQPPPANSASAPPPADSATPPPAGSPPPASPPPPVATTTPPPVSSPPPPITSASPPPESTPPSGTGTPPVTSASPPPATTTPTTASPPPPAQTTTSPATPEQTPAAPPPPGKSSTATHSPPPPPISHTSSSSSNSTSSSDGSSTSATNAVIVVAVLGAGVLILLLAMALWVCCCRRKKKRSNDYNGYYNGGGGLPTKWQPNPTALGDPMKNAPPGMLPPPPGTAWGPPGSQYPPPPPPGMPSGELSSSGPHGPPLPPPSPSVALGFASKSTFSFEELSAATNGFSQGNLIGQGGFGYVYKGVLPNGKEVAIKQLKAGSGQGEREFQAEVDIISRVHHRYLVSLVGYCMVGAQRMLVYEFVTNNTLEYHLHGKDVPTMDWATRLKIALGSAKGLAYLHEDCHPRIIHRDIKSSNILLEQNFEAKVADFGLAKFTEDTNTHVSTRIMGTFGYLAPEYASSGKLTEKSDVFSFGVVLLELITGRKPVDLSMMEDSLVDWARPLMAQAVAEEKFDELVDPTLENNFNIVEMERMIASAAACVRHSARRRPKMSQIVRALEGDVSLEDLNEGVKPGQSMFFSSSSDYDSGSYTSNLNRFRKIALDSTEYTNEYSQTSEYGLNMSESSSSGEMSTNTEKHHH